MTLQTTEVTEHRMTELTEVTEHVAVQNTRSDLTNVK
jgi:hypothetical protein